MNPTPTPQKDIRYQCLITSLAILLFLTAFYFHSILSRIAQLASSSDMELPLITNKLASYPLLTLVFLFVMMILTIFFGWMRRLGNLGAILASVFLLFQGIAIIILEVAAKLPWIRMLESFGA